MKFLLHNHPILRDGVHDAGARRHSNGTHPRHSKNMQVELAFAIAHTKEYDIPAKD